MSIMIIKEKLFCFNVHTLCAFTEKSFIQIRVLILKKEKNRNNRNKVLHSIFKVFQPRKFTKSFNHVYAIVRHK